MKDDTAIWCFENHSIYQARLVKARTYIQEAVIIRSYIDKILKVRPLIHKESIINTFIFKGYYSDVDKFIQEIWNEKPKIKNREVVLKYLKKHWLYHKIKQIVKFTNKKEHTIESLMEEVWDNNEDLFEDRSEDSDAEDEDEDKD